MMGVIVSAFLMSACGGATASDPSDTVEAYLEAKISSDSDAIAQLICSELEATIEGEAASFASVDARIDGLACTANEDNTLVSCEGEIVATYGTEDRTFPLASYRVVQEDGEWRWCGESE